MIVPVEWCASLGGALTPRQQWPRRLLCASHRNLPLIDTLFKSRGNCPFGSECFLAPAPSGMLSSCSQWSPNGNRFPLHPLFIQTLHYFAGLLLLTVGWESTLFLLPHHFERVQLLGWLFGFLFKPYWEVLSDTGGRCFIFILLCFSLLTQPSLLLPRCISSTPRSGIWSMLCLLTG